MYAILLAVLSNLHQGAPVKLFRSLFMGVMPLFVACCSADTLTGDIDPPLPPPPAATGAHTNFLFLIQDVVPVAMQGLTQVSAYVCAPAGVAPVLEVTLDQQVGDTSAVTLIAEPGRSETQEKCQGDEDVWIVWQNVYGSALGAATGTFRLKDNPEEHLEFTVVVG